MFPFKDFLEAMLITSRACDESQASAGPSGGVLYVVATCRSQSKGSITVVGLEMIVEHGTWNGMCLM